MARKTSGNSCGRTGSPIGCSNHSMISSITAAMPGTLSSISPGRSCPSRAAIGRTWVIQCEDWYYTVQVNQMKLVPGTTVKAGEDIADVLSPEQDGIVATSGRTAELRIKARVA